MCLSICTSQMVMDYRSSAGYTPVDFAFVVAGDKGKCVVEMLDRDHQLLPRDTDSTLEEKIIKVWKQQKSRCFVVLPIPLKWKFQYINSFLCLANIDGGVHYLDVHVGSICA